MGEVKMRTAIVLSLAILLPGGFSVSQEPGPAQQPAEEQVAGDFEAAAPALFAKWLDEHAQALKAAESGHEGIPVARCKRASRWSRVFVAFSYCSDVVVPKAYTIEVKKTGSPLSPFHGVIKIHLTEMCMTRNVLPRKGSWNTKNYEKWAPSCLGKTYDECIAGGLAIPADHSTGADCTGGPIVPSSYVGDEVVTYRWTHGKWELESEEAIPPLGRVAPWIE